MKSKKMILLLSQKIIKIKLYKLFANKESKLNKINILLL